MPADTIVWSSLAGTAGILWIWHGNSVIIVLLFAFITFVAGLVCLTYLYEVLRESRELTDPLSNPALLSPTETLQYKGIPNITRMVLSPARKPRRERYLTGHSVIDEPLSDVLQFLFRDYVQPWYSSISEDEMFTAHIKDLFHEVIVNLSSKAKEVDWVNYLTVNLVDDFASHLRLFRQATMRYKQDGDNKSDNLLHTFFTLETVMERSLCRDLVCISREREIQYLQQVSEVLLYLLLPPADFQNRVTRVFLRELIANIILLPLVDLITDPDYINQSIVWMNKDMSGVPSDDFLAVLRCTDNVDELNATRQIVRHEIAVQRSRDTGGEQDDQVKQQLKSLSYVKDIIEKRIQRLEDGTSDTDLVGFPFHVDLRKLNTCELFNIPFEDVITNNIALSQFFDFMTSVNAVNLIMFHLNVEAFKTSAEQILPGMREGSPSSRYESSFQSQREAAQHIFNTYLSDQASSRISVDPKHIKSCMKKIASDKHSFNWFDEIQAEVMDMMQEPKYFGAFKQSTQYIKLLMELDLLTDQREPSVKSDEDLDSVGYSYRAPSYGSGEDSASLNSLGGEEVEFLTPPPDDFTNAIPPTPSPSAESYLCASIYNTGIVSKGASGYALYAISVSKLEPSQIEAKWCVFRRYSDFYDFHAKLQKLFPHIVTTPFPGKKTFNNMSTVFLEQRKTQLNMYLQSLLQPDVLKENADVAKLVEQFLEPGQYEHTIKKSKRGMGVIVNPLRTSVKTVGTMVKNVPENIFDGLRDGLLKMMKNKPCEQLEDNNKVGAGIDVEADDNIPFRILLLLMDEVFDLKSRNTWLRRRIIVFLRQIVKTTFGDTINRKIVESVENLTSSERIADYVKTLKNALWPNGILAEQGVERDAETKNRTRVAAKMLLLCSVTDDLRRIIGSDTARRGMLCVFDMFQHQPLNRRLVYVLMEGMLATLFPNNKFGELFRQWHAPSPTISMVSVAGSAKSPMATPEMSHRQFQTPPDAR